MKVAVHGLGSMGARRVRDLRMLGHTVTGIDLDPGRMTALNVPGIEGDEGAVVISTPADSHRLQGCPAPHLVEKPLSTDVVSARSAFRCDEGHDPLIQVGYNWRFDPLVEAFRSRIRGAAVLSARVEFGYSLALWRVGTRAKDTPYAQTGVLLEASHEIDLIRWIFGEPEVVGAWVGRRGWDIPAEDTALAILLVGRVPVELHLDMTRPFYWRELSAWTPDRYLGVELTQDRVEQTYLEEMRAFCRLVETGERDERAATFQDGVRALEIIEAIKARTASAEPQQAMSWG